METRDFNLAKLAVGGLLYSTGALVFAGVMSLFGDMAPAQVLGTLKGACILAFGLIAVFALAVCQAAASCFVLLSNKENRPARVAAGLVSFVTGLVSVAGVYLGDAVLNGHPVSLPPLEAMLAGGLALAFVKPTMSGVITACEQKERADSVAYDVVLTAKDKRIADLERELEAARAALAQTSVPALANKDGTPAPARPAPPRRYDTRPRPGVSRRVAPSLPLTEEELLLAVNSIVNRDGAKVVSLASVAREAETLLNRPVPKKRVEMHPKRREIFEAVKAA